MEWIWTFEENKHALPHMAGLRFVALLQDGEPVDDILEQFIKEKCPHCVDQLGVTDPDIPVLIPDGLVFLPTISCVRYDRADRIALFIEERWDSVRWKFSLREPTSAASELRNRL
jgi:hypothetical protein